MSQAIVLVSFPAKFAGRDMDVIFADGDQVAAVNAPPVNYDNVEDAVNALRRAWATFEERVKEENGLANGIASARS